MSLLSLLTEPNARSHHHYWFRPNSHPVDHHQHHWLALNPSTSDDEDDLVQLWRVPRRMKKLMSSPYYRHPRSISKASHKGIIPKVDKDQFRVNIDVQQFAPEEITVKATGNNTVTVEGKHEERPDEHGSIYRHFVRRYVLPEGHDIERVESKLSSDGVLTITAPKISKSKPDEREITVVQTNKPSIAASELTEDKAGGDTTKDAK